MDHSPEPGMYSAEYGLGTHGLGTRGLVDSRTHGLADPARTGNNFMAAMLCSWTTHVQQLSNEPRTTGVAEEL